MDSKNWCVWVKSGFSNQIGYLRKGNIAYFDYGIENAKLMTLKTAKIKLEKFNSYSKEHKLDLVYGIEEIISQ
jgi:hypothetical protein